jgi:hypothetical protein
MDTPAINAAPIELPADSATAGVVISPNLENNTRKAGESRKRVLEERSRDPGVIVDVPREPTAEEVQAAKSADGMTTPAVDAGKEFI